MANAKDITITATLPFDWMQRLPEADAARVGRLLLGPVSGLSIQQTDAGYVPNANGGQTSMWDVTISGIEALSWPYLRELVAALINVGPTTALVSDLDNGDVSKLGGR